MRGLRLALQSYNLCRTLITEELIGLLNQMIEGHGRLEVELARERKAKEDTEERVKALEAEKSKADAKRAQELEMKQSIISNLEAYKSKQSAAIKKLKGEVAELKVAAQNSRVEMAVRGEHIKFLEEELEVKRLARSAAEADAHSTQQALQNTRVDLESAREAHEVTLSDVKSFETRLNYMSSKEGRKEVIEDYRHSPLGKVELAMAIKAGFDFLKNRLPSSSMPPTDIPYPPSVQNCLSILQDLEARGGGIQLGSDEGDEDDDDEDDDDEDDNGGSGDDQQ